MARSRRSLIAKRAQRQRQRHRRSSGTAYPLIHIDLPDGSTASLPLPDDADLPDCTPLIASPFADCHYYKSSSTHVLHQRHDGRDIHSTPVSPSRHIETHLGQHHPLLADEPLPDTLLRAIDFLCSRGINILQDRENQTRCVRRLGQALSRIRKLWVKRMPKSIRAFCAHLHLPLMLVLLRRAGYADWRLPAELVFGLAVHGRFSVPGNVFAPQSTDRWTFKPPSSVLRSGCIRDDPLITRLSSRAVTEDDQLLWDGAIAETKDNTMGGPYPTTSVFPDHLISSRFIVHQLTKDRPCDDYSKSSLNDCQTFGGKITLPTLDVVISMYRQLKLTWDQYASLRGTSSSASSIDLSFWNIDHKSAYRQVAAFPLHSNSTLIALKNPIDSSVSAFLHYAQAFGSRSSVWNYMRLSQSLVFLARTYWSVPLVSYIDDYSGAEDKSTVSSAYNSFLFLNSILGWQVKEQKCSPPSADIVLLGVRIQFISRTVHISLPPDKRDKLISTITDILHSNTLHSGLCSKLCGKLNFALSTFASRAGRALLRVLFRHSRSSASTPTLSYQTRQVLRNVLSTLRQPSQGRFVRLLSPSLSRSDHIILYSDAEEHGRLGGVLCRFHHRIAYFSEDCPNFLRDLAHHRKTQIAFYECAAALACLYSFAPFLSNKLATLYIDANSIRYILLRGSAAQPDLNALALAFWRVVHKFQISLWLSPISSPENPADAPSRRLYSSISDWDRYRMFVPDPSWYDFSPSSAHDS